MLRRHSLTGQDFEPKGPFGGSAAAQIRENNEYYSNLGNFVTQNTPYFKLETSCTHYNNQNLEKLQLVDQKYSILK